MTNFYYNFTEVYSLILRKQLIILTQRKIKMSNTLFISHVFESISMKFVSDTLREKGFGTVDRIEWVSKVSLTGNDYKSCFVFFNEWRDTPASIKLRNNLEKVGKAVIYYERSLYWNVFSNTSEVRHFRENVHMDLEVLVSSNTTISVLMNVFNGLNLGEIHSIELIPDKYQDFNESIIRIPESRNGVFSQSVWDKNVYSQNMLARVHFNYWYRTIEAVKFQQQISIDPHNEYLCIQISDTTVWKVYVSTEKPLILPGNNPFIWINDEGVSNDYCEPRNVFDTSIDVCYESDYDDNLDFVESIESTKYQSNAVVIDEIIKRHMDNYCHLVSERARGKHDSVSDIIQFGYDACALEMLHESCPDLNIARKMPPCMFDSNPWRIVKIR